MLYTMMQVCKQTNMTYQALKFYCNEGLIPNVKRDKNNRRVFDEHDIAWISSLICLKKCGMSIQEMKEYLAACKGTPIYGFIFRTWEEKTFKSNPACQCSQIPASLSAPHYSANWRSG